MITQVEAKDLVFIDEAGVNLAMARLYARALQGHRAYRTHFGFLLKLLLLGHFSKSG